MHACYCLLSFIWRACVLSCARFWTWMLSVVLSITVFTYLLSGAPKYNRTNVRNADQLHTMCSHSSSPPTPPRLFLPLSLQNAERASKRERHIQKQRERELRKLSCRKDRRDRLHVETLIFSIHSHNKHEYTISLVCLSQGILGHG